MSKHLTSRQAQVLSLIEHSVNHRGMPPSLLEISGMLGSKSPTTALGHLAALEKKGFIERTERTARGIRVISHSCSGGS